MAQLNRLADLGFSFNAADDPAFQGLKDDPGFLAAAQRLADNGNGPGRGKIIKLSITGGSKGVALVIRQTAMRTPPRWMSWLPAPIFRAARAPSLLPRTRPS